MRYGLRSKICCDPDARPLDSTASEDLYDITRYIQRDNSSAAREVAKTVYDSCESLTFAPYRGRKGRIEGTRELVIPKLPYLAVYRVSNDVVEILHIYHGARHWP